MKLKKQTQKSITGIIISALIFSFALASLPLISAADGEYCLKKLYNGESVPAYPGFTSKTKHLNCKDGRCTAYGFSSQSGSITICTDPDGYFYSNLNKCDKYCESGGEPPGPLTLAANFPFEDNGVFTRQNFFMDIYTNKIANIGLIDNVAGTQKNLCPNCMVYKKSQTFKQGFNDITIRAVKGLEVLEKRIRFFIDNKKPRISKTLPQQNKYANGDFMVYYNEENLKEVELFYGSAESPVVKQLNDCENGLKKNCMTNADLSAFDNQEISYWFSITDIASNNVMSRAYKIKVDKTSPLITSFNYSIDKKYVNFLISITEVNYDRIVYYDNDETRAKTLCTSLKNGVCKKKISFKKGHHMVKINAKDKAGNIAEKIIEFDIV